MIGKLLFDIEINYIKQEFLGIIQNGRVWL